MSSTGVQPIGTNTSIHGFNALENDTYTASRLSHATPEHLHHTTRRFFIGPIPEGWLNSNRKSWYKRRLELSSYSSRAATFTTAQGQGAHHRTLTVFDGPSSSARIGFSFPQPDDVGDTDRSGNTTEVDEDEEDADVEPTVIEPLSTNVREVTGIIDQENSAQPNSVPVPDPGKLLPPNRRTNSTDGRNGIANSPGQEIYTLATENQDETSKDEPSRKEVSKMEPGLSIDGPQEGKSDPEELRISPSNLDESYLTPSLNGGSPNSGDASSMTRLLEPGSPALNAKKNIGDSRSLQQQEPGPSDDIGPPLGRTGTGVRFKAGEVFDNRQQRIYRRVDSARDRVDHLRNKRFRRSTLQEGAIVKMEKMLVRVDFTQQQLEPTYDENDSMKTETRTIEKWREFMVVTRRSHDTEAEDFRLQMYNSRVVPKIDSQKTKKKPAHEVRLDHKTTHVNLYSSLDKTVVIWHPYKKGTRILILRPSSVADSVEWYTFLRESLGWKRPSTLQVNVPDLDVTLRLDRPFEGLETLGVETDDETTTLARAMAAEQAVAGKIIDQCLELLEGDPEWSIVLKTWNETAKMGLAWKRYDRLEWVYGVQERKMYGTMAMMNSYDLELRPKEHYPTCTFGKKGVHHDEPPPVEGFLIRLTSQKGIHQRLGKTYFKRLYYSTHNQFMMFNRPAKATPPHPPHLATISGTNIPSSHDIVENTPIKFDVDPFSMKDGEVAWLSSGNKQAVSRRDREAFEEARRNMANLESCDGYINMCHIVKVRKMKWGEHPIDDDMDSGSEGDVDFHQEVDNSHQEDGTTGTIDNERTFEIILKNDLIIRLQAYDVQTRKEWVHRLRKLVKYWKLRTTADMELFKSVRKSNLTTLNIDEEMEAVIGQFARKWEVSRSEASPTLYHMCGISSCRSITMSGLLYRKPRRHSTFQRCGVILAGGQLMIFQASLRKRTGEQVRHIHQEKQQVMDLRDCYVYSGLITEDDLLYQNQTFDSNHPGLHALPRVYLEDGWTSRDEDTMTSFAIWHPTQRSWFRAAKTLRGEGGQGKVLKRVSRLGVPGRTAVFKCRSRAERDHWVLSVNMEIERLVQAEREGRGEEVRVED